MDVTPNPKMFQAMSGITDLACGEEPSLLDNSPAAANRRQKRMVVMGILHSLVALSMREGVNRKVTELQHQRQPFQDSQDKDAIARAHDDAQASEVAGGSQIVRGLN